MYEVRIDAVGPNNGPYDAQGLRQLSWAELVARVSAARDLRNALTAGHAALNGSFSADAVRRMDHYEQGKRDINPIGLAHCKAPERIQAATAQHSATGDRGTE